MDEPPDLQHEEAWRLAVWALRVGYGGLITALVGLVVLWSGATPWVLGVGVVIWLAAAFVTLTGFLWARHELPEPRPTSWSMRSALIGASVHVRTTPPGS